MAVTAVVHNKLKIHDKIWTIYIFFLFYIYLNTETSFKNEINVEGDDERKARI